MIWLCLFVSSLIGSTTPATPPDAGASAWTFVREDVRLELSADLVTVRAEYRFHLSPGATACVFRYPFPHDASLGPPELLQAYVVSDDQCRPLTISVGDDCWRWLAEPGQGTECAVHIAYRQTMSASRACYVLKSTQAWGRPIDEAYLEVRVPEGRSYRIVPSLPLVRTEAGIRVYGRQFRGFFPDEDLLVEATPIGPTTSCSTNGPPNP
jgi:hypothetical protein